MTITATPAAVRPRMLHNVHVTNHAWDRIIDMCDYVHVTEDVVRRMATDPRATVTVDRNYAVTYPLPVFVGRGVLRDSDPNVDRFLVTSDIQPEIQLVVARRPVGVGMSVVTVMYNPAVVTPGHPAYADMIARKG